MLNLRVPLVEFETPASFLSRLAKRNGCSYARDLCRNLGVDFQGVVDARAGTLDQLAELGGVDAASLHRFAVRRTGTKSYSIGTERMGAAAVRRETLRFCPACLLDDMQTAGNRRDCSVAGRSTWQVRSIRTCRKHGLPLIEVPCPSNRLRHDFLFGLEAVAEFAGMLQDGTKAPDRSPGGLETYLHRRLFGGDIGENWLNTIEVPVVARAAEIFGAVARQGVDLTVTALSEDELYEGGAAGFDILAGGQGCVRDFLASIQKATQPTGVARAQSVFGPIYRWLAASTADEAVEPIRRLVREHIVETMSVAEGDIVLGEPLLHRRIHSVYSASREFGVHPKTLRKFLVASGLVPDDEGIADAHANFEAAAGERLIAKLKRGIPEKPLRAYLNVPRPALRTLILSGLLTPMIVSDDMNDLFDTDDVDRFIKELTAAAVPCRQFPVGSLDIPSTAGRANCSIVEVVRLVQAGKLKGVVCLEGVQGFMCIGVNLDEVKAAVRLPALPGMIPFQLIAYFGIKGPACNALLDHGILQTVVGKNPVKRCPQRYVPWQALEAFSARYVSLRDLSNTRGINARRLMRDLAKSGIHPEIHLVELGAYFFDRALVS